MNERIKELAKQAGVFEGVFTKHGGVPCDLKGYGMLEAEMAKFAELIVKECATAFEAEVDTWKEIDPYQGSIKRQGIQAIKKHFGVEE